MPISIPMMQRRNSAADLGAADAAAAVRGASTFVPPHMLPRQEGEEGGQLAAEAGPSLGLGLSPSASAKRDKLLARNAILRSTGFIEVQQPVAAVIGERRAGCRAAWLPPRTRFLQGRRVQAGGLGAHPGRGRRAQTGRPPRSDRLPCCCRAAASSCSLGLTAGPTHARATPPRRRSAGPNQGAAAGEHPGRACAGPGWAGPRGPALLAHPAAGNLQVSAQRSRQPSGSSDA